jgi:site-specific recombinase XerD
MDKSYWVLENDRIDLETVKVINDFLSGLKLADRSKGTISRYRFLLGTFFVDCQKSLGELVPEDIRDWTAGRYGNKTPATIIDCFSKLSGFFSYCLDEGYVKRLLVKKRWRPRLPAPVPKYLDKTQQAKVRLQAEKGPLRDRTIYEFLLSSGCRRAEAAGLDVNDVDLPNRTATVTGKGNKTGQVHFSELCVILLKQYLKDHPDGGTLFLNQYGARLSESWTYKIVVMLGKKAKLNRRIHPHCLRHTFATNLLGRGAQMNFIKEELRHKEEKTTQIYATLLDPQLVALYRKYMG